ncbi:MAG: hypothetical protein CL930_09795 [Deltaproteobacteria bacterium]|nr:hypothetical protein [Deltaproteobacteria bacterium]
MKTPTIWSAFELEKCFSGASHIVFLHPHREENTSPRRPCGQRGEGSCRESIGFHFKGFRFHAEFAINPGGYSGLS